MLYVRTDRRRLRITTRMLVILSLSLQHGQKAASYKLGVSQQTVKNTLTTLYQRLNVEGMTEAACALGWVRIPADLLDAPPEASGPVPGPSQGGRPVAGSAGGARHVPPAAHR